MAAGWYHYQGQPSLGPLNDQPLPKAADGQTYLVLAARNRPDSLYHEAIVQPLALKNNATYLFELDLANSPLDLTDLVLGRWKSPGRLQLWLTQSLENDFGYFTMEDPQPGVKIYDQKPETSGWKRYKFRYTVPKDGDFQYLVVRASAEAANSRALVLVDYLTVFPQAQAAGPPAQARSATSGPTAGLPHRRLAPGPLPVAAAPGRPPPPAGQSRQALAHTSPLRKGAAARAATGLWEDQRFGAPPTMKARSCVPHLLLFFSTGLADSTSLPPPPARPCQRLPPCLPAPVSPGTNQWRRQGVGRLDPGAGFISLPNPFSHDHV